MGHVIERSPSAFEAMSEEHLRFYFLVILNSLFGLEGTATGETFNPGGKTDILIRWKNKNLFVAECKVWRGPATVKDAIDQLLSYLTWRDSRTALMLFVKNRDFGRVMSEAVVAAKEHAEYKRSESAGESEARLVFTLPGDKTREVHVALIGFHLRPPAEA